MSIKKWWVSLAGDELKMIIGLSLVLATFAGITMAQSTETTVIDFGIRKASSNIVISENGLQATKNNITAKLSGSALVTNNDGDTTNPTAIDDSLSSPANATVQFSGLQTNSVYLVSGYVRLVSVASGAKLSAGSQATTIQAPANETGSSSISVSTNGSGTLTVTLSPASSSGVWTVNYLTLRKINSGTVNPDFNLSIAPAIQTGPLNAVVEYLVTLSAVNNFSETVAIEVQSLPTGVTASVSPGAVSLATPATVKVLLTVSDKAVPTVYTLKLSATSQGALHLVKTALFKLQVTSMTVTPPVDPIIPQQPIGTPPASPDAVSPSVVETPTMDASLTLTPQQIRQQAEIIIKNNQAVGNATPTEDQKEFVSQTEVNLRDLTVAEPANSKGTVGRVLDYFEGKGTISKTVDNAPVPPATKESLMTSLLKLFGAGPTY
jgi:hypothetical protein